MSASNPSRFLATGSDDFALSLEKQFMMKVVESWRDSSMLFSGEVPIIQSKTIENGKSHQFLQMAWSPDPEEHTPGDELLGQQFEVGEGNITVDNIIVRHADVPLDQWALSHFDIVSPLAMQMGEDLARYYDQILFNLLANTARAAAATKNGLTLHNGGNRIERVGATVATAYPANSTGAGNFRTDAASLAEAMDNDNVPESGRYLFITPYIRRVLSYDTSIFSQEFTLNQGNSLNSRAIGQLEGFMVIPVTNRIPSTTVTSYSQSKYNGDFLLAGATGQPVALAACGAAQGRSAIGVVKAFGLQTRMRDDDRRNTMFMKAQILMGAGQLHPYCAGSIEVDDA